MPSRWLFNLLLAAAAGSLLLYAWLGSYAHPMGDDWSYARMGMDRDLVPWLIDQHRTWNGRYFSNILVWADPMAGGLDRLWLYRCVPTALILLTFLGFTALLRAVLREALSASQQWAGGLLLTALFFFGMPHIGEGLYWYTGAISYQSGSVLTILLLAAIVNHAKGHFLLNRPMSVVAIALLTTAAIGCSEVNMLVIVAGALVAVVVFWRRTGRAPGALVAVLVLAIACGAFMFLAPGNAERASYFETKHELWRSLGMSLLQVGRFGLKWLGLLLIPSLLYLRYSRDMVQRHAVFKNAFGFNRWWSAAALAAVLFLCVFPAYWNTGILGQHRTLNVAYAFFLPLWFINLTAWGKRYPELLAPIEGKWAVPAGLVITALWLFTNGNGYRALSDLIEGTAAQYDHELNARYQTIEAARATNGTITLPLITAQPKALYLFDITDGPAFWTNRAYGIYFGMQEREIMSFPAAKEAGR